MTRMPEKAIEYASRIAHGYEGLQGYRDGKYYPYQGKADKKGKWTIGRGHLLTSSDNTKGIFINGEYLNPWYGLTLQQVDSLFTRDMNNRVDVCWELIGSKGTAEEAGAWLDLFFNCPSAFAPTSTPLRRWLNGDKKGTAEGFILYTVSNGQHQRGLFRRRCTEALLLITGEVLVAKTSKTEDLLEEKLNKAGIKYKKPIFGR